MFLLKQDNKIIGLCFILFAFSIAMGALGAHGLEKILSEDRLKVFNKASYYLAIQSVAMIVLIHYKINNKIEISKQIIFLVLAGMSLFSLSLFLVSFYELEGLFYLKKMGWFAPFAGVSMILGWIIIGIKIINNKTE
jgi:uncharacterized membrane protein YgdD (TMEM256/DUF423 family)